ncbi:MAG: hypothetical protein QNJ97_09100 [Myxococcota bacterium]|nr:hypothetical protein [Myxococcota bacterium]
MIKKVMVVASANSRLVDGIAEAILRKPGRRLRRVKNGYRSNSRSLHPSSKRENRARKKNKIIGFKKRDTVPISRIWTCEDPIHIKTSGELAVASPFKHIVRVVSSVRHKISLDVPRAMTNPTTRHAAA